MLLLPQEALLERTVFLPLTAEREWATVMRYEMDRLPPFAAENVFWSGSITGRDRVQAVRDSAIAVRRQGGEAGRLITVFTGNGRIRNPAFGAPVTRNEAARTNSFPIRAEIGL